jgi:DNA replication protein DnaC
MAKSLGITAEEIAMMASQPCLTFEEKVKDAQKRAELINNCEGDGKCEKCKGRGYFAVVSVVGDAIYETEKACSCRIKANTEYHIKKSGLCGIEKFTFERFKPMLKWQDTLKSAAEKFVNDTGRWFFVGGQSGGGKTHICTAITLALIEKGLPALYMLWKDEWPNIRTLANDERREEKIKPWKDVKVLYIDDFLKHKKGDMPTDAEMMLGYEILNYRLLDESKITIISSEFMLGEILQLDDATGGRIYEKCGKEYAISIPRGITQNMRIQMGGLSDTKAD